MKKIKLGLIIISIFILSFTHVAAATFEFDMADCKTEIAVNETQGSRVVDYVHHVYGAEFTASLAKMSEAECYKALNDIGLKAVNPKMFVDQLKKGIIPLGVNFSRFYDEVYGGYIGDKLNHSRKDDIVGVGWYFVSGATYARKE